MNICLIPARSGSKRIKNKNIINFFGKPIISYAIQLAKKSKLFDEVIVSTDSKKIAKIAIRYGAKAPFIRPKNMSNDYSTDIQVINHFIKITNQKKKKYNFLCYLYPINPLLKISSLIKCLKLMRKGNCQKVMTVAKFNYPIQRALYKNRNQNLFFFNKKYQNYRSQDLKQAYQDAAQCYWFNLDKIKHSGINNKLTTKGIELNQFEFCDVDNLEDLSNLKRLYKLNKKKV